MVHKPYRYAWFTVLLLLATLACQAVTNIGETKSTVEAAATQVKGGAGVLGTVQAAATELGENSLVQTAVAAATEEGPGLMETVQSFATEEAPGLVETIESSMGEAPEDIPVIEGNKDDFVASEFLVSYAVAMSLQDVKDFYLRQMPANGWSQNTQGSVEQDQFVVMNFDKGDRTAAITLTFNPVNRKVLIGIIISKK